MGEEEHHNLFDGLADIRYARDFLRVVGPSGSAERARFDEIAWGYGDPTYMGGDLMEVFDSQLKSVLHTLFGILGTHEEKPEEDRLGVAVYHAAVALEEDEILSDISALDGGPVEAETIAAVSPNSIAEHLAPSRTGGTQSRRDYPGEGVASIGTGRISSLGYRVKGEPTGDFEDVMGVEISGDPEAVERFTIALLSGCGEGEAPRLYHWKPGTAAERMLREADPPRSAVILLVGFEYFDLRSMFHDVVFARLLAAWNMMNHETKREMKRESLSEPDERRL
jgi:hypothetical protein